MHYRPEDKAKQKLLDELYHQAWLLGYPKPFFDRQSELTDEIKIEDITEWELKYIFRE